MGKRNRDDTWIKLYRGIMNSSVWEDDKRFKAWIYILLETSFGKRTRYIHGRQVKLERGECFMSIRGMAKSIGCEPKTVKRILGQFEADGMINYRIVPGFGAFINPLKYKDYQSGDMSNVLTDDTTDDYTDDLTYDLPNDTTDDLPDDHYQSPHHKNDNKNNTKKEKKEKEAPPVAPEGAPDAYGAPPPGWDEACEKQFQEDAPQNPGKTRQDWWDFWMADSEGGDDE